MDRAARRSPRSDGQGSVRLLACAPRSRPRAATATAQPAPARGERRVGAGRRLGCGRGTGLGAPYWRGPLGGPLARRLHDAGAHARRHRVCDPREHPSAGRDGRTGHPASQPAHRGRAWPGGDVAPDRHAHHGDVPTPGRPGSGRSCRGPRRPALRGAGGIGPTATGGGAPHPGVPAPIPTAVGGPRVAPLEQVSRWCSPRGS